MKILFPSMAVVFAALFIVNSLGWRSANERTDRAIQVAKDWEAVAKQGEKIAQDWQSTARRFQEVAEQNAAITRGCLETLQKHNENK